jgi:hypothetical protein
MANTNTIGRAGKPMALRGQGEPFDHDPEGLGRDAFMDIGRRPEDDGGG